jgi:membrane-bound ClpP family serine protease
MTKAQVTLNAEQIEELNQKLSHMRHEINNQLSLVVAAIELISLKPELRQKMIDTVTQQPPKITAEIVKFSKEFEQALGIMR